MYTAPVTNMDVVAPAGGNIGFAAFTGAGAAIPTVSADAVLSTDVNLGLRGTPTIARTGPGDYTFTFPIAASPAKTFAVLPIAEGTTDLDATLRSQAIASGVLTVRVLCKTAAGVATDLAAGVDFLRLVIFGTSSTS